MEPRRGSQEQACAYCTKEDTRIDGPWRLGAPRPNCQGSRTDFHGVAESIRDGQPLRDAAMGNPGLFARYSNGLTKLAALCQPQPRWRSVRCFFFYGPPGAGKTSLVYDTFGYERVYSVASVKLTWWDGYCPRRHDVVLLDEYPVGVVEEDALRILDGHPVSLPVKGSFVEAAFTVVVICSNFNHWSQASEAFKRRFKDGGAFFLERGRGQYAELGQYLLGLGPVPEYLRLRDGLAERILPSFVKGPTGWVHAG